MDIYSRKLPSLKQLQYFVAISDELSFRKAAAKLNMTQPSLSQQIKELEIKLNTNLMIRNNKSIVLTKDGEYFREKALTILNEICLVTNSLLECLHFFMPIR